MNLSDKITVIIPTHERHQYLKRSLGYWSKSNLQILVADSSGVKYQGQVPANVHYFHYPDKSFTEKIVNVLSKVETDYSVFCSDKDFLVPNGIEKCVKFLEQNPDYSIAHGIKNSIMVQNENLDYRFRRVFAVSRSQCVVINDCALLRLQNHFQNYAATFYSIHRTRQLLRNFMLWNDLLSKTGHPYHRLGELFSSGLSIIYGKSKELDVLYQIRQIKPDISVSSQLDWRDDIVADDFSVIYERAHNHFTEELIKSAGIDEEEARDGAKEALAYYIKPVLNKIAAKGNNLPKSSMVRSKINHVIRKSKSLSFLVRTTLTNPELLAMIILLPSREVYKQLYSDSSSKQIRNIVKDPKNRLTIESLLSQSSPYHSDFMPIHNIVKRYPNGIERP